MSLLFELTTNADKILQNHYKEKMKGWTAPAVTFQVKGLTDWFLLAHGTKDGNIYFNEKGFTTLQALSKLLIKRDICQIWLVCCHPEAFPDQTHNGVLFQHLSYHCDGEIALQGKVNTIIAPNADGQVTIEIF